MGGVLKCERTLELTCTDLKLWVFTPFGIEVYQLYGRFAWSFYVGTLNLCTPIEVADFTVEDETGQTQVESVGMCTFFIFALILEHAITTKLNVLNPLRNLYNSFLFLLYFLSILYFCIKYLWFFCIHGANETCHQHDE